MQPDKKCIEDLFHLIQHYSKELERTTPPYGFRGLKREGIRLIRESIRDLSNLKARITGIEAILKILKESDEEFSALDSKCVAEGDA